MQLVEDAGNDHRCDRLARRRTAVPVQAECRVDGFPPQMSIVVARGLSGGDGHRTNPSFTRICTGSAVVALWCESGDRAHVVTVRRSARSVSLNLRVGKSITVAA